MRRRLGRRLAVALTALTATAVAGAPAGVRVAGDPRQIPLGAHDVIQLAVGRVMPFKPYVFAPGL